MHRHLLLPLLGLAALVWGVYSADHSAGPRVPSLAAPAQPHSTAPVRHDPPADVPSPAASRAAADQSMAAPRSAPAKRSQALRDLDARVRYGRLGRPIDRVDPVVERSEAPVRAARGRDVDPQAPPLLTRVHLVNGEAIAEAWYADGGPPGEVGATLTGPGGRPLAQVTLAGDPRARATLPTADLPPGALMVLIHDPQTEAVATHRLPRPAQARLTGHFESAVLAEGRLLEIAVEVDNPTAGARHVGLSLYRADGTPVGFAQTRLDLPAGAQWMRVHFGGPLLCDAGGGPFVVRHALLSEVDAVPARLAPRLDDAHTTAALPIERFDCSDIGDPRAERQRDFLSRRLGG